MTETKTKNSSIKQELYKSYQNIPKPEEIVKGTIFSISKNGIFVDIKNFKTGIIFPIEIKKGSEQLKNINIGNEIEIKIKQLEEDEHGYLETSFKEARSEQNWEELKEIKNDNEPVKAQVVKANKGGLILDIKGLQAFMPVSHLSTKHYPKVKDGDAQKILQALQKLVKENLEVKIIDLNSKEEKIIVSEKAAQSKDLEEAIKKYKIGDLIDGTVAGVVDFGVFVEFDGLEGLVHISELDYQLIEDPSNIIKKGDNVKAKIIDINKDKISLSIKALKENPWEKAEKKYKIGQTVKGKVTKFNPFGAFVQLDEDIHGLTHVSEFGSEEKMKKTLDLGKKYDFEVLSIKPDEYKMSLKPILKNKQSK